VSTVEITQLQRPTEPVEQHDGLGSALLLDNVRWYTRVRWIVVSVFILAGLVGCLMPGIIDSLGFVPPTPWAWWIAVYLAIANMLFFFLESRLTRESSHRLVSANIWLQIIVDLAAVTVVVHLVGSTETFIPFCYVIHVTMACIFFSRKKSFLVVALAAILYLSLVCAESVGMVSPSSVLRDAGRRYEEPAHISLILASAGVMLWGLVWYLVSSLALHVRERDIRLDKANRLLIQADEEKNREVLRTAHDLKAPFSGIESNIQVLKMKHWEETPDEVREIIDRIQVRSRALAERIKDILVLGSLRSRAAQEVSVGTVGLKDVLGEVIGELLEKAEERNVAIEADLLPAVVSGNAKQLGILFTNILSNAILYSHEGQSVKISVSECEDEVLISISDQGIGIKEEGLPHIFEEYYKTKEAAKFNKLSTGLGLAIVKRIALNLGLGLKVTSEPDKGTMFEVAIPKSKEHTSKGE
jgi:signal transduction histidine kinase